MTRVSTFPLAAMVAITALALLPGHASAQPGSFCGGYVTVEKITITPESGGQTRYFARLGNPKDRPMSYALMFEGYRYPTSERVNIWGKASSATRILKPGHPENIALGYTKDVAPLNQEEVLKGIRISGCK